MTTLDTLGSARPDLDEVSDAALAMADFDAKGGDFDAALEWLAGAAPPRALTGGEQDKRKLGEGEAWPRRASRLSSGPLGFPVAGPAALPFPRSARALARVALRETIPDRAQQSAASLVGRGTVDCSRSCPQSNPDRA